MILAVKRLHALGWIALIFIVAITLYPLSLSVAALRSDLNRVESDIVSTKREIRYLETEFATRASLKQLEKWNDLQYGYVAPTAEQYLEGERALARIGDDGPVRMAAMTLPGPSVAPAGTIGSPFGEPTAATKKPAKEAEDSGESSEQAVADAKPKTETKPQRVASQLLDEKLVSQLALEAKVEQMEVRR